MSMLFPLGDLLLAAPDEVLRTGPPSSHPQGQALLGVPSARQIQLQPCLVLVWCWPGI